MLHALTVMGRILLVVPLVVGIVIGLIDAASSADLKGDTVAVGGGLVMLCGISALGYVGVKRFRRGLRGDE